MNLKPEMTIPEVAEALRVARITVYRWIVARKLNATKKVVDGSMRWMISDKDLKNYLKED